MNIKITDWLTGETILEVEAESVKTALEAHVALKLSLDGARLVGARLVGARLDGASLDGARLDGARLDGASLVGARLDGASLDGASLVGARLVGARLVGARLVGARLDGASLVGASLDGASARTIIDAGSDRRGYRFWAWNKNGQIIYRAGCREWDSFDDANGHFGDNYVSDGNREECVARLTFLRAEAARRWNP